MSGSLTPRQQQVLEAIEAFYDEWGYYPTLEEIRAQLGLASIATVHKHLSTLEAKGFLRRDKHKNRSVHLVDPALNEVPLKGTVAAGQPIEAIEDLETVDIPASMLHSNNTYALRVSGDSMIEEQIADGDIVIVERRDHADNGELVVALVDGEDVTLKRYFREGEFIRLQPANARMHPLIIHEDRVQVQSVVIGLLRSYG